MFVSAELQTLRKIFIYLRCLSPERLKTQHEITAVIVNNGNLFQQFNNLLNKCKPDTNWCLVFWVFLIGISTCYLCTEQSRNSFISSNRGTIKYNTIKEKNNKSVTTDGMDGRSDTLHHPRGREIHGDIY